MVDPLAQHYFMELQTKKRFSGISFKKGLIKLKLFQMYVWAEKLCTKLMQEEHDVLVVGHHGESVSTDFMMQCPN